jgi:hypothetical protein
LTALCLSNLPSGPAFPGPRGCEWISFGTRLG